MPKVSVIIPVYGVEKFINRCAQSLFQQTLDDIEFLFIDDCTLDNSMQILKNELEKYPDCKSKVKIYRMPCNSGLPAVRKYGVALSKGEYIAHCDSDDWVSPNMYKLLYEKAKKDNLDIVWCDYYRSDGVTHIHVNLENQPKLIQGPVWNKLIRRSLYIDNEIDYPKCNKAEDGALMTQLSFYSQSRGYISDPLYYYFINPNSICGQISEKACLKKLEEEINNTELRINFLKRHDVDEIYKDSILLWKLECRKNLVPILYNKHYRHLWRNTYKEINKQILFSKFFSFKFKLRFILSLMNPRFKN